MALPAAPSLYMLTKDVVDKLLKEMLSDDDTSVQEDFDHDTGNDSDSDKRSLNLNRKGERLVQEVGKAIVAISTAYSDEQLKGNPRTDLFLSPVYRCAYVYRYFVSHAYILKRFLLEAYCRNAIFRAKIDNILNNGEIRLCALGGGPGTDVAGLMLFLHAKNLLPQNVITPPTYSYNYKPSLLPSPTTFNFSNRVPSPYIRRILLPTPVSLNFSSRNSGLYTYNRLSLLPSPAPFDFARRYVSPYYRQRLLTTPATFQFSRDSGPWNVAKPIQQVFVFGRQQCVTAIPSPPSPLRTIRYNQRTSQTADKRVHIRPCVLDNCPEWKRTADVIFETYQSKTQSLLCWLHHINYNAFNFTQDNITDQQPCVAVQNADFVTMVKVVSAIAGESSRRAVTQSSLEKIFSKVKQGALIFYMDNAGGGFTAIVDKAARTGGLRELYRAEHKLCMIPSHEKKEFLQPYWNLFKTGPQTRANVSAVLWQKN